MIKRKNVSKPIEEIALIEEVVKDKEQLKEDEFIQPVVSEYNKFDRFVKEENLKISVFFVSVLMITVSYLNINSYEPPKNIPVQAEYGFENVMVIPSEKKSLKVLDNLSIEKQISLQTRKDMLDFKIKENIRNKNFLGETKNSNSEKLLNIKIIENERQKKVLEDDLKKVNDLLTKKVT